MLQPFGRVEESVMLPCPSHMQPAGRSLVDRVDLEGRVYQREATHRAKPSDTAPLHAQGLAWLWIWIAGRGCRPRGERLKRMADPHPAIRRGSRISLLVDADAASPGQIEAAIRSLGGHGGLVETSIFCAPGRAENAKMRSWLSDPSITFRPVARKSREQLHEPNDAAIVSALGDMAKEAESDCIAVMTSDKDFVTVIKELRAAFPRIDFVAVIPARRKPVRDAYESAGIRVAELPAEERCSRVRAILDVDGSGRVEMTEAYDNYKSREQSVQLSMAMDSIFQDKGLLTRFIGTGTYPMQLCAKLGYVNTVGPMVVFPLPVGIRALHAAVEQMTTGWSEDVERLAYFLPCTVQRNRAAVLEKYGSALAMSIFRGGGPFMLKDSDDVVLQALHKLGYLDDAVNDDLPEAMTCILNNPVTNIKLRKLGIEVHPDDGTKKVAAKLRDAFTSNHTDGRWRRGDHSKEGLLRLLRHSHPRLKQSSSENEIYAAMKEFASVHGLPQMRSFNGQAWCIKQYVNRKNPSRRGGQIEIKR